MAIPIIVKDGLEYCPDTGWFYRNGERAGGSDYTKGYRRILWNGKRYKEHRLAWYFCTGEWPKGQIDHIDEDKANNKISNLRDVSQTINMYNKSKAHCNNKSKFLGVSKITKGYEARLRIGKHVLYLGIYKTPEEANSVYSKKKKEVMESYENV